MKIGLDLDEVVVDLTSPILVGINSGWGLAHDINIFAKYNFFDNWYTCNMDTNREIAHKIVGWVNDPGWLLKAQPFEGVISYINDLKNRGHTIHFITSRLTTNFEITRDWLIMHDVNYDTLHAIGHDELKSVVVAEIEADVYVDDYDSHVNDVVNKTKTLTFLLDKPYNKWYINKKITRLYKLRELDNYLDKTMATNEEMCYGCNN